MSIEKNIERIAEALEKISISLVQPVVDPPMLAPRGPVIAEEKEEVAPHTADAMNLSEAKEETERAKVIRELQELGETIDKRQNTKALKVKLEKAIERLNTPIKVEAETVVEDVPQELPIEEKEVVVEPPKKVSLDQIKRELQEFAVQFGTDKARGLLKSCSCEKISDLTADQRVEILTKIMETA